MPLKYNQRSHTHLLKHCSGVHYALNRLTDLRLVALLLLDADSVCQRLPYFAAPHLLQRLPDFRLEYDEQCKESKLKESAENGAEHQQLKLGREQ